MKGSIIFFWFIVSVSCTQRLKSDSQQSSSFSQEIITVKKYEPDLKNIVFSYEFEPFTENQMSQLIANCNLTNNNKDTLFFLTSSCYGWTTNFKLDTSLIETFSSIDCFVSNPIIQKILPKDSFKFKAHFFLKKKPTKKIELNYYIYQVPSYFDLHQKDLYKNLDSSIIQNK